MQLPVRVGIIGGLVLTALALGQACSDLSSKGSASTRSLGACATPPGFSGSPQTIEQALELINALPRPVTVACFLESLKRPLGVNLTNSITSAQPAFSNRSPRIFILIGPLTISVVPEGVGSEVVEFSEMDANFNSLKGEIGFPVTDTLSPSAAYDKVKFGTGTACRFCHTGEFRDLSITSGEAYRSVALQPRALSVISLESLRAEWAVCDAAAEPKRCEILRGLFGYGDVVTKRFPPNLFTF